MCLRNVGAGQVPPEGNIRPQQSRPLPAELLHSRGCALWRTSLHGSTVGLLGEKNDAMAKDVSNTSTKTELSSSRNKRDPNSAEKGWLICSDNPKTPGISLWNKLYKAAKLWNYNRVGGTQKKSSHATTQEFNMQHICSFCARMSGISSNWYVLQAIIEIGFEFSD